MMLMDYRLRIEGDERLKVINTSPKAIEVGIRPSGYPRAWFSAPQLEQADRSGRDRYALGDYLIRVMGRDPKRPWL